MIIYWFLSWNDKVVILKKYEKYDFVYFLYVKNGWYVIINYEIYGGS